MRQRGALVVLRSVLLATALSFAYSEPGFAIGPGGGGGGGGGGGSPAPSSASTNNAAITIAIENSLLSEWGGNEQQTDPVFFYSPGATSPAQQQWEAENESRSALQAYLDGDTWQQIADYFNGFVRYEDPVFHQLKTVGAALFGSGSSGGMAAQYTHLNWRGDIPYYTVDPQNGVLPAINFSSAAVRLPLRKDLSKALNLDANQQFTVFANLGASEFKANANSTGLTSNGYTIGGSLGAKWSVNANYVRAAVGLNGGHISTQSPAVGNSTSGLIGYSTDLAVGRVFALSNPANQILENSDRWRLPAILLDTSVHVGYSQFHGNGYTDGTGFVWGDSHLHSAVVGFAAKFSAPYLGTQYLVTPYLRLGLDHNFDSAQWTDMPAQGGAPNDQLIVLGTPTNTGWVEAGVSSVSRSGLGLTVSGNYSVSNLASGYGGRLSLNIPFVAQ